MALAIAESALSLIASTSAFAFATWRAASAHAFSLSAGAARPLLQQDTVQPRANPTRRVTASAVKPEREASAAVLVASDAPAVCAASFASASSALAVIWATRASAATARASSLALPSAIILITSSACRVASSAAASALSAPASDAAESAVRASSCAATSAISTRARPRAHSSAV